MGRCKGYGDEMSKIPPALRDKLISVVSATIIGIAGGYAIKNQIDKPSTEVLLAHEIGAYYESSGKHIGVPYVDKIGKGQPLTVCNGVTGKGVIKGKYYTPEECFALELPIYLQAERDAKQMFKYWNTYNVWVRASLIDMIYNLGAPKLRTSTLVRKANNNDLIGMCMEMPKWVNGTVNGKSVVQPGLVARRGTTKELCAEWGSDGHFSERTLENLWPSTSH